MSAGSLVCIAVLAVALSFTFPNYVHYYATYDPAAAFHIGARPVAFHKDIAWVVPVAKENASMVVMAHGRSGNVAQLVPLAKELIKEGHGVFMFEMPRQWVSQQPLGWLPFAPLITHERARHVFADAAKAALAINETAPLVLYGHSLGGVYALQIAPGGADAVITDGTPFSFAHIAAEYIPLVHSLFSRQSFYADRAEMIAFHMPEPTSLSIAWLGIHSVDDTVVPVSHLTELEIRTKGVWNRTEFAIISGPHYEPARPERVQAILQFLQHLS